MTTPLDNKRLADMSTAELQERQAWLEGFPAQWWSNKVGYGEQKRRESMNELRKMYLELIEEEIAMRLQGGMEQREHQG